MLPQQKRIPARAGRTSTLSNVDVVAAESGLSAKEVVMRGVRAKGWLKDEEVMLFVSGSFKVKQDTGNAIITTTFNINRWPFAVPKEATVGQLNN